MNNTKGYAAQSPTDALAPFSFQRREVQAHDVQIDILYCGVCHSDIHQARNEWGGSIYPMVPGHEIVGRVIKTGDSGDQIQDRRPGRRRMLCRFLSELCTMQGRSGTIL